MPESTLSPQSDSKNLVTIGEKVHLKMALAE
jgi:hypothetical protein